MEKEFDFEAGAILNFNKPIGKSSFWVVKKVRNAIKTKVGHAGTLDPFAEGVLLLCTGKATKQVSELMELTKEYIGEIELGIETDTDDRTGKMINRQEAPELEQKEFERICKSFIGDIYQVPPMFSAKKINGRRLYQIARKGKVIEREPKLVHIETIDVLSFCSPIAKIKVTCSKGTYIRALARDIGQKIGCGAHLKSLIRTKIGEYAIKDSITLNQFEEILNCCG
ncbi:MAG: tRNA pseudouridine(55) synthase TruB [bacterium]|nr:MAG: tRNA pseudouridine(55) synthase TruB [bacterium]